MKKILEKLSFKNSVKLIICIVAISACVGCSDYIELEQEVDKAEILKGTYYVVTKVWVRDWKGSPIVLELRLQECVKANKIDSVKTSQLIRAEQIKKQLEPLLKH